MTCLELPDKLGQTFGNRERLGPAAPLQANRRLFKLLAQHNSQTDNQLLEFLVTLGIEVGRVAGQFGRP